MAKLEAAKPPIALGDSVFVTKRERRPLPPRPQIGQAVQEIIDEGGVQKVLLQVGHPILVEKLIPQNTVEKAVSDELDAIPTSEARDDLYFAVRNAEMEELRDGEKYSALEALFRAFVLISHRRLRPLAFLVQSLEVVRVWMKLDQLFSLEELFGVTLLVNAAIPEGTVLLAAGTPEGVEFSIRISVGG